MVISVECKSRFSKGTILAGFSPEPSDSIGSVHEALGKIVINGFAHGASSVVATFDREACFWMVDCTAQVEEFAISAGFNESALVETFLELCAGSAIMLRPTCDSVVLRERRRHTPRWKTTIVYDLGKYCGEATDDDPFTLGNLATLCAHAITSAIGGGGHTIRFELFSKLAKLIVGDDGCSDDPIRSDEDRFNDFQQRNVASICTNSMSMQPCAEA